MTTVVPKKKPTVKDVEKRLSITVPTTATIRWSAADQQEAICNASDAAVPASCNFVAEHDQNKQYGWKKWKWE